MLADPARCGFDVSTVVDGGASAVTEAVEGFLVDAERSDLLLLYFSCHGLKDESGRLYFAARNTRRNRLRSTAVSAAVVNELLLGSRSRRKVLLLDCCYGGAFAKGMQVKADTAVHTGEQFDARGLVVVTASDSTQYAFDGDEVRATVTPSRFTAVLVDGSRAAKRTSTGTASSPSTTRTSSSAAASPTTACRRARASGSSTSRAASCSARSCR